MSDRLYEWDGSAFVEKTIKAIDAARCREYFAFLMWLDKQPPPNVSVSDDITYNPPRRTVSGFHNRLTQSQHL